MTSRINMISHHHDLHEVATIIGENQLDEIELRAGVARLFDLAAQRNNVIVRVPDGKCICDLSPDGHSWPNKEEFHLDARCPRHGVDAQPSVWFRHPTAKLWVKISVWNSLGVTYARAD